jgi:1-deoxy-D-xylulose 5-phosphate reductoisomerase
MHIPIQYALTDPDRRPAATAAVDLVAAGRLDFRAPDAARFPALRIAREAGRIGQAATTALIAADDVAVARFLDGSLGFTGIPALLEAAVERHGSGADQAPDLERFPALRIAREAARLGSRAGAALIAADEVAVKRFLGGTLEFSAIPRLLEGAVARFGGGSDQAPDVAALIALDAEVRAACRAAPGGVLA